MNGSVEGSMERYSKGRLGFHYAFVFASLLAFSASACAEMAGRSGAWGADQGIQREVSLRHLHDLRVRSQVLARIAGEAVDGRDDSFEALKLELESMEQAIAYVRESDLVRSDPEFSQFVLTWERMKVDANAILGARTHVLSMADSSDRFIRAAAQAQNPCSKLVMAMISSGSTAAQTFIASRQEVLAQRMARRMSELRDGTDQRDAIALDSSLFMRVLNGLRVGNSDLGIDALSGVALAALDPVDAAFAEMEQAKSVALDAAPKFLEARSAEQEISAEAAVFLEQANILADSAYGARA